LKCLVCILSPLSSQTVKANELPVPERNSPGAPPKTLPVPEKVRKKKKNMTKGKEAAPSEHEKERRRHKEESKDKKKKRRNDPSRKNRISSA